MTSTTAPSSSAVERFKNLSQTQKGWSFIGVGLVLLVIGFSLTAVLKPASTIVSSGSGYIATSSSTTSTSRATSSPAGVGPTIGVNAGSCDPATLSVPAVNQKPAPAKPPGAPSSQGPAPTSLITTDIRPGSGTSAQAGDALKVEYVGTLLDGTEFDSSWSRQADPFSFTLGQGAVIKGWDQGLVGMQVGGQRLLTIPPDLAYGAQGQGGRIPPNATLVFIVDLLQVCGGSGPQPSVSSTTPYVPSTLVIPTTSTSLPPATHYVHKDTPIQASPSPSSAVLGTIPAGASIAIICQATGPMMSDGDYQPTNDWNYTVYNGIQGYATDLYTESPPKGTLPRC